MHREDSSGDLALKEKVRQHWELEVCGTRYKDGESIEDILEGTEKARYALELDIPAFAEFEKFSGKRVLEIGVGGGVDHLQWYKVGADVFGIDLTDAAVERTFQRLRKSGFSISLARLHKGDAEGLDFPEESFDLVYSWGVLHHTPDTPKAFSEILRVLKRGGQVRAMIYHHPSWTALLLWILRGHLRGRPFTSPRKIVFEQLESPGTKTYTLAEAERMLREVGFSRIQTWTRLSTGDLLITRPSSKYQGRLYSVLFRLYPRWIVRMIGHRFGLNLLLIATK
jgi:ubiquinone/menaquinone biosynthesis C-methylase UbiE